MDVTNKIQEKLNKILKKLKNLGVIQAFKLEIKFCPVKKDLKRSLSEIDAILKKCVKRIISKSKKAEIRNIITELVRKKNLNDVDIAQEPDTDLLSEEKSFYAECTTGDATVATAVFKFQCGFCNEVFDSKKSFATHKKVHKNPKVYLCDKCGKIFRKFKKWQQHLEGYGKQPALKESYTNVLENEMLNNEYWNEEQMKAIPFENLVKQPCVEETKNFYHECKAENQVAKKKEEKFICACGKGFNILKTLRKHEKLKHSLENIKYKCSICEKYFLERGKLNRHMLSHKESQYQCSFCSKQFSRSDTLKRHLSLFHYASREFLCSFCQKKFKLKFNRDVHEENIHKNIENRVQCQDCGQKFRNKVTLKSHLKIHSDNRISCSLCNKSFSRKSYYKSHVESKHSGAAAN